jgi:ribonuclease BN (tRNA processing enzyme)
MKLTVLGGSAAGPNPGQGCSGYLVESGTTRLVVDLGAGTFPELRRHADYRQLDAVVVSHGHLDHFLDILTLRYALAYNPVAADRRLPLWLPPGGLALLTRLAESIADDPDTGEFLSVFDVNQYDPVAPLTVGELELQFHPTVHYVRCWAIRISNRVDGDLFYTADTGPAANLAAVAKDSYVVVAEGTDRGRSQEPFESRGHLTPAEAGALARDARASVLVLSHLWAEDDPFQAVREASQTFGRPVELATPGLRLHWQGKR